MRAQNPDDQRFALEQHLPRMRALSIEQLMEEIGSHASETQVNVTDLRSAGAAFLRQLGKELCQPGVEETMEQVLGTGDVFQIVQALNGSMGGMKPVLALLGAGIIVQRMGVLTFCETYGLRDTS